MINRIDGHSDKNCEEDGNVESLIKNQIEIIKQKYVKPGWNLWLLLSALATCLWIFSVEIEKGIGSINLVLYICVTLTLIREIYTLFPVNMLKRKEQNLKKGYYTSDYLLSPMIRIMLFDLIACTATIIIFNYLNLVNGIYKLVFNLHYVFVSLGNICALISTFCKFPIPNTQNNRNPVIALNLIGICIKIYLIYGIMSLFRFSNSFIISNMNNIRMGCLLFVILYLVSKILAQSVGNPILISLEEIYQDLLLGNIRPEVAKDRAQFIINGLNYRNYIRDEFVTLLKHIQEYEDTCRKISRIIDNVNKQHNQLKDENEKEILDEMARDSTLYNKQKLDEILKKIEKVHKKFTTKSNFIKIINKRDYELIEVRLELEKVLDQLKSEFSEMTKRLNQYEASNPNTNILA